MTPDQIAQVQTIYDKIAPIHVTVGALFYRRLFELNPELRPLFHNDLTAQSRKLMDMIELVVNHLSEFESLQPRLRALAQAHIGYGARDEHYDFVRTALVWAIRQGLEDQFTPADEIAWLAAYDMLADTMKASAASARLDDPQQAREPR